MASSEAMEVLLPTISQNRASCIIAFAKMPAVSFCQPGNGNPEALRSVTVPLDSAGASGLSACWYSENGTQGGFVLSAVYAADTSRVRLRLSDNNTKSPPFFVYR